jgi:E3 ubiquitin-protein ligase HECTD2
MPSPHPLVEPSGPNNHHSRSVPVPKSPIHARGGPDANRGLPPPPSSSVDNYDIPALRRKPVPDQPSPNSQHTRSFSHPFPSFFSSKRSDKKQAARPSNRDAVATEDEPVNGKPNTPASSTKPAKPDRQPVTGKCITCDSTVRWPQGLKVFRCTTCLTINDLEPFIEPRPEHQNAGSVSMSSSRKPVPLSLDRTRGIIDHSLTQFFDQQIRQTHPTSGMDPPLDEQSFLVRESIDAPYYHDDESPPPSPRPTLKVRSTSDPALTPMRSKRRDLSITTSNDSNGPLHDNDAKPHPSNGDRMSAGPPSQPRSRVPVFSVLENYITGAFTGCATLNASFFTVKPPIESRPVEDGTPKRQVAEPLTTPTYEPDDFMNELDAKTLLLGDFAENGSWWLGGRSVSSAAEKEQARRGERSPERWKGIVTVRTPRINWMELAEWYRLIINAGEIWRRRWYDFRSTLSETDQQIWKTIPLERLQQEISDSQIHLQRCLLKSTENLLKRPRRPLKHPEDCRFLLMLLCNPLLYPTPHQSSQGPNEAGARANGDSIHSSPSKRPQQNSRKHGNLGHHSGIIKRILGLISNLPNETHQFTVSWFSRLSDSHFERTVDLVGSFVTYRLSRQQRRPAPETVNPTAGLVPSFLDDGVRHPSQLHAALEIRSSSTSAKASEGKPKLASYGEDWQVRSAARVMALLFQANIGHTSRKRDLPGSPEQRMSNAGLNAKYQAHAHGQILPVSSFYNSMLDYADLVADFETWEGTKSKFTFCQYPFFLSIYAKIHIMEHDARRQMENKAREAFFDSILSRKAVSQYLVLKVRRDCLVDDSLRSVSEVVGAGAGDIKKGLRIDFVGEEGIDAGGLRKEWFLLLTREIFDPNHGLFVYDDDSHYCYFNPYCFESSEQFFLVGVLLGLAIYNSTILDVAFPPFVFKKMLASAPSTGDKLSSTPRIGHGYSLEDLAELRPSLARGLRQLLEFEGNVESTFCRDFVVDMDRYGAWVQVPLCSGGEKRAVNNSNRKEFVDLYVHYLLDTAVARQYEPFKRGFFTVCGGNALSLFRPEEIELLVRGSDEPLDISSLRAVAVYENWPKKEGLPEYQPQVVWFWQFFQRVTPADQRKILSFITGSDRIPAMGATNLIIKISLIRSRDEEEEKRDAERFPTARTCFNTLALYRYRSREKLESKLWMAVTGSEGFGLK